MVQAATHSVQFPDDKDIAFAQSLQTSFEARTIVFLARGLIGVDLLFIYARLNKSVLL